MASVGAEEELDALTGWPIDPDVDFRARQRQAGEMPSDPLAQTWRRRPTRHQQRLLLGVEQRRCLLQPIGQRRLALDGCSERR